MSLRLMFWFILLHGSIASASPPQPLPAYSRAAALRDDSSLLAVAFADDHHGIACGDRGTILKTSDGGATWTLRSVPVDCSLRDVVWIGRDHAIIVGGGYDPITRLSRGVVLLSRDRGHTWEQVPDQDLPCLKTLDEHRDGTLVAGGDWSHALLAKRFASRDGGRNWQLADERQTVDLLNAPTRDGQTVWRWTRAIGFPIAVADACRIAGPRICAVGDHGAIAVSDDEGESWRMVRGHGRSAAVLVIARRPETVAWALVGREALEHRGRVALLVSDADQASMAATRQAAIMLGGTGADLISSNRENFSRAVEQWIEVHRPSVLLLDEGFEADLRDSLVATATQWGVARVASYSISGSGSTNRRDALLHHSGVLISDLAADAQMIVAPDQPSPALPQLHYLYDASPANRHSRDLISGLQLRAGQRMEATLDSASRRQLQILQARLTQSARIATLFDSNSSVNQIRESFSAWLDQTAAEDRLRMAWSALRAARENPNRTGYTPETSIAVLDEMGKRFAAQSIGKWAQMRSSAIAGSAEWRRLRTGQPSPANLVTTGKSETIAVSPFQVTPGAIRQASAVTPVLVPERNPNRIELAGGRESTTPTIDLAWELHPLMILQRAAAQDRGGDGQLQVLQSESAELQRLAQAGPARWRHLVATNLPTRAIAPATRNRPRLDGQLHEACWGSPVSTNGGQLEIAFDADYVYVGATVPTSWFADDSQRQVTDRGRDLDLTGLDRVQLRIDTDRDLVTSMDFEIHDTGGTRDGIDGNIRWQPTWYVATHRQSEQISIELAILRRDLVDLPITSGESWFVSLRPISAGHTTAPPVIPNPDKWLRVDFE